jgi:hypothetical protein
MHMHVLSFHIQPPFSFHIHKLARAQEAGSATMSVLKLSVKRAGWQALSVRVRQQERASTNRRSATRVQTVWRRAVSLGSDTPLSCWAAIPLRLYARIARDRRCDSGSTRPAAIPYLLVYSGRSNSSLLPNFKVVHHLRPLRGGVIRKIGTPTPTHPRQVLVSAVRVPIMPISRPSPCAYDVCVCVPMIPIHWHANMCCCRAMSEA